MVEIMMCASSRAGRIVALLFALACGSSMVRAAPPVQQPSVQQPPVPQGVWFSRRGLDPKNNKIDALISMFGFICLPKNPLMTMPCRIETELESLLRNFPPDQSVILQELRALGATCRGSALKCEQQRLEVLEQRDPATP